MSLLEGLQLSVPGAFGAGVAIRLHYSGYENTLPVYQTIRTMTHEIEIVPTGGEEMVVPSTRHGPVPTTGVLELAAYSALLFRRSRGW
jgi:hypothetical protein